MASLPFLLCYFFTFFSFAKSQGSNYSIVNPTLVFSNAQDNETPTHQGWTSSPDGRGTFDIIWNCAVTIFLCTWTALCLNIPPREWSDLKWLWQKFMMAGLGLCGPEFVLQLAFGQWSSACRSYDEFKTLALLHQNKFNEDYQEWTMAHAFLADMGGFQFATGEKYNYPLDARQIFYLVSRGYIDYKDVAIPTEIIEDKNKGDILIRLITILQILWFSLNCIGRAAQHLAITTLELTTLGFIMCTLGTYFFWFHKPLDVRSHILLHCRNTLQEIADIHLRDATPEDLEIMKTSNGLPFDFLGRELDQWQINWSWWMGLVRKLHLTKIMQTGNRRYKIPDDYFPKIGPKGQVVLFFFQVTYGAILLAGWNFDYPSHTELIVWRTATCIIMGTILAYWVVDEYGLIVHPWLKRQFGKLKQSKSANATTVPDDHNSFSRRLEAAIAPLRNNTLIENGKHDPAMTVQLKQMIPFTIIAITYMLCRAYVLIEDFVNLRELPVSAYATVEWSEFIPHF